MSYCHLCKLTSSSSLQKTNQAYTEEALDLTSRVLAGNPEYPSGWAFRRRILLRGILKDRLVSVYCTPLSPHRRLFMLWWLGCDLIIPSLIPQYRPSAESQAILEGDLALTAKCLTRNPKEYAIWEHRKWVLKTMPDPDWGYEFKMVQALLERDARNCKS